MDLIDASNLPWIPEAPIKTRLLVPQRQSLVPASATQPHFGIVIRHWWKTKMQTYLYDSDKQQPATSEVRGDQIISEKVRASRS